MVSSNNRGFLASWGNYWFGPPYTKIEIEGASIMLVEYGLLAVLALDVSLISPDELTELLRLVVTVSGVASTILAAFVARAYYDSATRARMVVDEIKEGQLPITGFRVLCKLSLESHNVWQLKGSANSGGLLEEPQRVAAELRQTFSQISEGVYGDYHKYEEGQRLLNYGELVDLQEAINHVWYLTGGRSHPMHSLQEFLRHSIGDLMLADEGRTSIAERVVRESSLDLAGQEVMSFDFFHFTSGELFLRCERLKRQHGQLENLSPRHSLAEYVKAWPLLAWGVVAPLVLLSFEIGVDHVFVLLSYAVLLAFSISVVTYVLRVKRFMREDFYAQNISKP